MEGQPTVQNTAYPSRMTLGELPSILGNDRETMHNSLMENPMIIQARGWGLKLHVGRIAYEHIQNEIVADAIFMYPYFYIDYVEIRRRYPDAYPPMDFEIMITAEAKRRVSEILSLFDEFDPSTLENPRPLFAGRESFYRKRLISSVNRLDVRELLENLLLSHPDRFSMEEMMRDKIWKDYSMDHTEERIRERPWEVKLEQLIEWILEQYESAGFTWRYFMFYNANAPSTQASQGLIRITPDIFEAGTGDYEAASYLEQWDTIAKYRTTPLLALSKENPSQRIYAPFTTWSKESITKAIFDSGLALPVRDGPIKYGIKNYGIRREMVKLEPLPRGPFRNYVPINLEGLDYKYYNPRENLWVYITVYRKLFNTMNYINWQKVFESGFLVDKRVPLLADEFGLNTRITREELWKRINEITEKRTRIAREIAELVPHRAEEVTYQPNSVWLKPVSRYRFADAGMTLTKPYEQFVFIKMLCEDDSVDKDQLLRKLEVAGMSHLFPGDPNDYEKHDICDYLIEHIGKDASKYERLFFSCNDPDVNIQSILNTLKTMELESIIKNLDLNTITKDDLCRVINNYLNLLLEAKARNVAELS